MFHKNKAVAIFGTQTGVGKSFIATALCRIFKNQGKKVAPFKAQVNFYFQFVKI